MLGVAPKRAIQLGAKYGLVFLILFGFATLAEGLRMAFSSFGLNIFMAVFGLVTNVCYLLFLLGMVAIADERSDRGFATNLKIWFVLTAILIVMNSVLAFLDGMSPLLFAEVPIMFAIGILNIRVSKNLRAYVEEYGDYAKQASEWEKIAGWLTITIFLAPIGYLVSLMGDYYMWRMLQKRAKKFN